MMVNLYSYLIFLPPIFNSKKLVIINITKALTKREIKRHQFRSFDSPYQLLKTPCQHANIKYLIR